jgi:hypothetical protein
MPRSARAGGSSRNPTRFKEPSASSDAKASAAAVIKWINRRSLNGQIFDVLEPEHRLRDTYGDGRSSRFITSEHDEMMMPQAIEVRDAEGRRAVYAPLEINGKLVRRQRDRHSARG